jgi:hypothetical protein
MCAPASFVLTKEAVFWSMNTDSHENIIAEFALHQDGVGGPNVLRVEITPPAGDFAADPACWSYKLDQDFMPEWFEMDVDETRARAALIEWVAKRVIREGAKKVASGRFFAYGSASVEAYGSASVVASDSASVVASGSARVEASDSASVVAYGSASVVASDSASVVAYESASVVASDSASVVASGGAVAAIGPL